MDLYRALRPLLFALPAETSHHLSLGTLRLSAPLLKPKLPKCQPIDLMGLSFPNRIGLAAGLDKNADYVDALAQLGFGFIEVGTVTPKPQQGNAKPRLFRIPQQEALINRMGFNNKGVDHLVKRLERTHYKGILGINIGKNTITPNEQAYQDYQHCLKKVHAHASYITINISSPNTVGLRDLQAQAPLTQLLDACQDTIAGLNTPERRVPLVVKVAPQGEDEEIRALAETLCEQKVDGVILTNTRLERPLPKDTVHREQQGGLSGKPIDEISTQLIQKMSQALQGRLPIIASGGVFDAQSAQRKLASGAQLIQIYTGLIYRGPKFISDILQHTES